MNQALEKSSSYKLKTVLKHLNMSTFDYDIQKDTLYVRKDEMLLHGFTDYWFTDGGDYYYLENLMETLPKLIRKSFLENTLQQIEKTRNNTSGAIITFDAPIVYQTKNTRWTNFVVDTVLDEDGKPTCAIGYCKDIHEQKKELYRVYKIAQTDFLTGLPNRSYGIYKIINRLQEEPDEQHFLAVIDLNKFKEANDLYGHSFGDQILKNISERIMNFQDHDSIFCRTGGDEFMYFRKCDNEDHAMRLLTELKNSIRHSISHEGVDYLVDASIGFSMHPAHSDQFDNLYKKADIAMYHAKQNKTDGAVIYNPAMASIRK